jgi:hypothetical protein
MLLCCENKMAQYCYKQSRTLDAKYLLNYVTERGEWSMMDGYGEGKDEESITFVAHERWVGVARLVG